MSWRRSRLAGQIAAMVGIAGLWGACSGGADSAGSTTLTLSTDATATSVTSTSVVAEVTPPSVGVDEQAVGKSAPGASPVAAAIMNEFTALGLCDTEWVSDLESAAQQTPAGAPLPQESWSCATPAVSVGVTLWNSADEMRTFFATLIVSDRSADIDFDAISALRLDDRIVVGAFDAERGTPIVEVIERMQEQLGGEVVSYADLAR